MRIISGKYKSRKLLFKKSLELRPTQDRVKETMFNVISNKIVGSSCLDLFAGSGSLGFEAISRGANKLSLIDIYTEFLKKNHALLNNDSAVKIIKGNAINYLKKVNETYDIVFIDPPWKKSVLFEHALKAIFEFDILKINGILVCEHPIEYNNFYLFSVMIQKKFGNKKISILENLNEKSIISR